MYWIEEPTLADDFAGHAKIAAAARVAIQLGENWWEPHDMAKSSGAVRDLNERGGRLPPVR